MTDMSTDEFGPQDSPFYQRDGDPFGDGASHAGDTDLFGSDSDGFFSDGPETDTTTETTRTSLFDFGSSSSSGGSGSGIGITRARSTGRFAPADTTDADIDVDRGPDGRFVSSARDSVGFERGPDGRFRE